MRSAKIKLELDPNLPRAQAWSNPIVPGDHPDPTILRVGRTFWASATSGEWSPQFPLFRSADLVTWSPAGAVFPIQPSWAEGSFWAPELVHDEVTDRFLVWYVGRKRGGPLCIAVATASDAAGPYTDHGPVVCEADGSIDPCFARDEHGEAFLIWKEDGNSQGRSTPIWAQRLSDDLLHLSGEKTLLITNDQAWEEGVVEGAYILRKRGLDRQSRFYMFYAGNSCCGRECKYAEGVARADYLLGPWEKNPANPLVGANDRWRCPGHGTVVHTASGKGRSAHDYLLYHAYPEGGTIYVGREAVMDEVMWPEPEPDGKPGWPIINQGKGPGEPAPAPSIDFIDEFESAMLGPSWQWPVNTYPGIECGAGMLTLSIPMLSPMSPRPVESAMVAVPRPAGLRYEVSVIVEAREPLDGALWAGLAIVGDPFNTIGLGLRGEQLILWQRRGDTQANLWQTQVGAGKIVHVRCTHTGYEHHLQFSYSADGETWQDAGAAYDASDLPAWDRGLRIGLMLEGPRGRSASFRSFGLRTL